jgi:hypothetical protein
MNKNSKKDLLSADPLSDYFNINERQLIMDESPGTRRGNSNPSNGSRKVPAKISNMFNLQSLADAHITSVLLADQIIKDQKDTKKTELESIERYLQLSEHIEKKVDSFHVEKKAFSVRQVSLTKENEQLKLKFS